MTNLLRKHAILGKPKRTTLEAFNERQDDRQLHPTKGWRKLNVRRSRAQMLMADLRMGLPLTTREAGSFIREGIVR